MSWTIFVPTQASKEQARIERALALPVDPEAEHHRGRGYRYHQVDGRVRKVRVVQGGSITAAMPTDTLYSSPKPGAPKNTFTAEAQINDVATMGTQAKLPDNYWNANQGFGVGRPLRVVARGLLGSTGTPTLQWIVRLALITGPNIGGTAALTTLTTVSTKGWEMEFDVGMETMLGAGGNNSTLRGAGFLTSPGGLAAPGVYEVWGGGTQPGTVTMDVGAVNLLFFDAVCGTSNVLNTITLLQLIVLGLN